MAQSPSLPLFPVVSRTASVLPLQQRDKATLHNLAVRIQLLLKTYSSINTPLKFIATLQVLVMLRPLLEVEHQLCPLQGSWLQLQDEFSSLACCSCSHHPLQRQPQPWDVVRLEGRQNWTGKNGSSQGKWVLLQVLRLRVKTRCILTRHWKRDAILEVWGKLSKLHVYSLK